MRVNSSFGNQAKSVEARQSIYSGRDRIGDVAQREGGFVARDRAGRIIGTFNSALEAADAVSAAVERITYPDAFSAFRRDNERNRK
jgi:hypothetical protein